MSPEHRRQGQSDFRMNGSNSYRSKETERQLVEARRLLARALAVIKLGEMEFIKEVCAFLERTDATSGPERNVGS